MEDLTRKIIFAIKEHKHKTFDDDVVCLLSNYYKKSVKYYSDEITLNSFARRAFIDYIRTADNSSFEINRLFELTEFGRPQVYFLGNTNFGDRTREGIWRFFDTVQVKNESGKYINGFNPQK